MSKTHRNTHTVKTHSRRPRTAAEIIDRITGHDPELRRLITEATLNAEVAEMLHKARTRSGLTQKELADRLGTKQPVIARLEDGEYTGHSLTMLQRIAVALGCRLQLRLVPTRGKLRTA